MKLKLRLPDYHTVAANWLLWQDRFIPESFESEEEFNLMTISEKVGILGEVFGPEQREEG